ncbi:IGF-like family receptor 1 isoform X2 [Pseudorasbora parva]|uniref:IGF-like family receptor 1 isoform X2 n=1 Tax=Pseudorasbora parva TaxID=51549 RepID=UPI00351F1FAC
MGRCIDGKFFNNDHNTCQLCRTKYKIRAGNEFTKNCGWSNDKANVHSQAVYKACSNGTFNDGSHEKCQPCRPCITPQFIACSTISDTICCKQGEQVLSGKCLPQPLQTTEITTLNWTSINSSIGSSITPHTPSPSPSPSPSPAPTPAPNPNLSPTPFQNPPQSPHHATGIYVSLVILSALTLVCLFFVIKKRRTNHFNEEFQNCNGAVRESLSKKGINRYEQSISYNIIKENDNNDHIAGPAYLLAPKVQRAPLKTVLNNLDVLEELVLVLDPDISGTKNTRHLASQCSFSFAWINYAYSMKDHKSPLVCVLEGVVTKNPDWTVGHLAELLTAISRNDAVEILAKLESGVEE